MRRLPDKFRISAGLITSFRHRRNPVVEVLPRPEFTRLRREWLRDHPRLMAEPGAVHAEVGHARADLHDADTSLLLERPQAITRHLKPPLGQMRMRLDHAFDGEQLLFQVIVAEHRKVRCFADAVSAHRHCPGVGIEDNLQVAEEFPHLADAHLAVIVEFVSARPVLDDNRLRQERRQLRRAAIGADCRPAAAFRPAECLVQHEHAGIEAKLTGADLAHHAVEIGVIVEGKAASLLHQLHPFLDLRIVDAHVVRVIDHERRSAV